jgi:hypothetical protein
MARTTPKPPALTVVGPGASGPQPPRQLGAPGRQFWDDILREFTIEDRAGLELLCLAAESLDRAADLDERIRVEGATIKGRGGMVRVHPAIKDQLACRAFTARCIERLGLNLEAVRAGPGRPARAF